MDLADIKEKILVAKKSVKHLLVQISMNMEMATQQDARLANFCETGCRAVKDANFLASNLSWLESLNLLNITKGASPIRVEFPDFASMHWLTNSDQKRETFASQLEGLLDDMRSLEIPSSADNDDGEEVLTLDKQRTLSPNTSECSSIEILEYGDDDSIGTVTPEGSTCDFSSSFEEYCDNEQTDVGGPTITLPTTANIEAFLEPGRKWHGGKPLSEINEYLLSKDRRRPKKNDPAIEILQELYLITDTQNRDWLHDTYKSSHLHTQFSDSYPNDRIPTAAKPLKSRTKATISSALSKSVSGPLQRPLSGDSCPGSECETSSNWSVRSGGVKRKADPFLFGLTHGRFTERSRWLSPPLAINARVGNSLNYLCQDTRRWLADYKLLKTKDSTRKRLHKSFQ